jgi:hypothetical protein
VIGISRQGMHVCTYKLCANTRANMQWLNLFRTGSIIPTFDPSVDTINEAKSELVVTLSQRWALRLFTSC